MADATSGGLDIAGIISKLAPIFLGSGTTTTNATGTDTINTGDAAQAENAAVFSTALENATNPDITDAITQNILHNAALAFSPVLGEERSSGLYNTTVKQQLASEAQARATAEASQAALQFRTSQEQIASASAGQLTAATKKAVTTNNQAQRTGPVIPGQVSATTLLTGASALIGLPRAVQAAKSLFGGGADKTSGISGFDPENNPELGGGRVTPDQLTDFVNNPDNADVFSGNAIGSEGQFGDALAGGQVDTASLAPIDVATIADPVAATDAVTAAVGGTNAAVVGAGEVGGGAVTAAEATDTAAAAVGTGAEDVAATAPEAVDTAATAAPVDTLSEASSTLGGEAFPGGASAGADFGGLGGLESFGDISAGVQAGIDNLGATGFGDAATNAGFETVGADIAGSVAGDAAAGVGADVAAGAAADAAGAAGADAAIAGGADAAGGAEAADLALSLLASVICTEFVRQGKIDGRFYRASAIRFAKYPNYAKRAYWFWAIPVTRYIRTNPNKLFSRIMLWLFNNRTMYIAAKMGTTGAKKTFKGKLAQIIIASFTTALGVATLQFLEPKHG